MSLEFSDVLSQGRRTGKQLKIPLASLMNHVLLVGGSGSGKTHFARAMLEEILATGIPTIVIDSQGDLLWLTRVKRGSSQKKRRLRALVKQVFTPDCLDGFPFVIAPALYSDSPETNRPLIRYWVRSVLRTIGYELKPGQTSPEEYQLATTSQEIIKRKRELSLETLLEDSRERIGNWIGDKIAPITPEDARTLISRLGALRGNEPNLYLGKPFSVKELSSPRKGGLWIIYLVPLPTEKRQLVVSWMCEEIYHWMMNTPTAGISNRPRLVLFIDEAADYVAQANLSEYRQALFRLLNQGRKYGVSLVLAVQTPRGLPPEVSNNCATKIFGAVDDPGDLNYVKHSTGLIQEYLKPLRNRSWKYAFVVRIPGRDATYCKARDLLTRKGRPVAPRSPAMTRILRFLNQFRPK
ncbi:type IV secretion system DNA-binding domain-containing protein [Candidatus Bathyarchaeota archaeon]|nr:type IV secretion system DNA-binding domain-containing protein [Candidatus Bathyarchaeota archaeon]